MEETNENGFKLNIYPGSTPMSYHAVLKLERDLKSWLKARLGVL